MTSRDTSLTALDLTATRAVEMDVPLQMDEEAFRGFYDRTSRQVWAYLHRLTGDPNTADDLLQDTYYRFLRASVPLEGEAHRRHYLFRIATNLANDRFRRVKTRPIEVDHDTDTMPGHTSSTALDTQLDVTQAMSRLRGRERAMLLLAYAHGASHQEIAQSMGLRPSSVKTLLLRARRRFAGLLGHRGVQA
ncbi:MAG: RNA polymerase sigma factor [Acidobacteriota bacterium]